MRSLQRPGRSPVLAPNGMASTSHALSTETAVNVLRNGGNAMDAAIAACAVQGLLSRSPPASEVTASAFILREVATKSLQ